VSEAGAAVDRHPLPPGPHETRSEPITLHVEGAAVQAFHARPVSTPLAGLVLVPDLLGLRPLFEDICLRLASHGFAVCAVEPFSRNITEAGGPLDMDARRARMTDIYDEVVLEDLADAADHLAAADGVAGCAILGFCMGGAFTLKAAATGRFERAVPFYGLLRMPPGWAGPGRHDAIERAADACPTLAIFGDSDPYVPVADIDALRAVWADRADHKVVVYPGADHGFVHDPDRDAHRPTDAADAWRRALGFLLE
jgi:carboxymethylenebutenolidase